MSDSMNPPFPPPFDCCPSSCDSFSCSRSSFSAIGFCAVAGSGATGDSSLLYSAAARFRLPRDHALPDLPRDVAEKGVAPVQDPGLLRHLRPTLLERLCGVAGDDARQVAQRLLTLDELARCAPRDLSDDLRRHRRELVSVRRRSTVRR